MIVFSGIQPTGVPHLGNYLGALRNWASLQRWETKIFLSVVDLHAITVPYDPVKLRKERDEMWSILYAVGIDLERSVVFEQSAVLRLPTLLMSGS
jgi:tryptophanyl-tRNA synthetase